MSSTRSARTASSSTSLAARSSTRTRSWRPSPSTGLPARDSTSSPTNPTFRSGSLTLDNVVLITPHRQRHGGGTGGNGPARHGQHRRSSGRPTAGHPVPEMGRARPDPVPAPVDPRVGAVAGGRVSRRTCDGRPRCRRRRGRTRVRAMLDLLLGRSPASTRSCGVPRSSALRNWRTGPHGSLRPRAPTRFSSSTGSAGTSAASRASIPRLEDVDDAVLRDLVTLAWATGGTAPATRPAERPPGGHRPPPGGRRPALR